MSKYFNILAVSFFSISALNAQVHYGEQVVLNNDQAAFNKKNYNSPSQESANKYEAKELAASLAEELFSQNGKLDENVTKGLDKLSKKEDKDFFFRELSEALDKRLSEQGNAVLKDTADKNSRIAELKERLKDSQNKPSLFQGLLSARNEISANKKPYKMDMRTGGLVGNGNVDMTRAPRANEYENREKFKTTNDTIKANANKWLGGNVVLAGE